MGKDRVTLYIKNVNISSLYDDKSLWITYSGEAFKDKYKHRLGFYTHGAKICNIGVFNVQYLRYSSTNGDLLLSFSVAKLYNGNNSIPKGNISTTDLVKRIGNELSDVLYIDKLPPPNTWKVSKDESNIDIIDSNENLKQRFELLKRIKIPYRRIDCSLAHDGTLYFHSGKDRGKSSAGIIVYYKGKEQQCRGNDIYELLGLDYGNEDLRIEVKYRAHSLKRKATKIGKIQLLRDAGYPICNLYKDLGVYNRNIESNIRLNTTLENHSYKPIFNETYSVIYIDINRYISLSNYYLDWQCYVKCNIDYKVNSLNTVMSKKYQFTVINDFIVQCGFDKRITTKDKLYKIIDNSSLFTKTRRKAAKRVIRFLNKEIYNIDLNDRTIEIYKKLILSTGYHYLYADRELKPITSDDILMVINQDKSLNMVG